jgi:uncharacterized protein YegP (UPF0339 family)
MAEIDVARVEIHRAQDGGWYAVSIGGNGERIAWTETYRDVRDAEAAAYTISAGAPVTRED